MASVAKGGATGDEGGAAIGVSDVDRCVTGVGAGPTGLGGAGDGAGGVGIAVGATIGAAMENGEGEPGGGVGDPGGGVMVGIGVAAALGRGAGTAEGWNKSTGVGERCPKTRRGRAEYPALRRRYRANSSSSWRSKQPRTACRVGFNP